MNSPIILLNNGVEVSPAQRESAALATLERLARTVPSPAAPLTDEDLAIFEAAWQRNSDVFSRYVQDAYQDYCYFYISGVTVARENAMEQLQQCANSPH